MSFNSRNYLFKEKINSLKIYKDQNIQNKLIPFIYIDGLKTMGSSCKKFDCGIKKNSLRNLKENSLLLNIRKTEEQFHHLINITSIENNIKQLKSKLLQIKKDNFDLINSFKKSNLSTEALITKIFKKFNRKYISSSRVFGNIFFKQDLITSSASSNLFC